MYEYFQDKQFLKDAQRLCSEIVTDVQNIVRSQGISCQFFLVGSGGRNMITYLKRRDGIITIDFDYNLNILSCEDWNDGRAIKETVRKAFNKVWLKRYKREGIQDSRSSLTSNAIYFDEQPNIIFSIDLAIVTLDTSNKWERLIHDKYSEAYFWNVVIDSDGLNKKVKFLKDNHHWDGENSVRDKYLKIKNHYLVQNDNDHPSFVCYIESVNETFQKWRKK